MRRVSVSESTRGSGAGQSGGTTGRDARVWIALGGGLGLLAIVGYAGYALGTRSSVAAAQPVPAAPVGSETPIARHAFPAFPVAAPTSNAGAPAPAAAPAEASSAPEGELPAAEHREKVIVELRRSGPDRRDLATPAARVAEGWSAHVKELGGGGSFGRFECYAKGCFVNVEHASEAEVTRATEVIMRTGEFNGWGAGKMRSGVVARADGKVEVTWVLYTPEEGIAALPDQLPPDSLDELRRLQTVASEQAH